MKFKNKLISTVLTLVLGVCALTVIVANTKQPIMVSADPEVTHVDHDGITFTAWTEPKEYPGVAGNYYLDVNMNPGGSGTWTLPEGTTNICLNGHSIVTGKTWVINSGSTLNLYDCNGISSTKYITMTSIYQYKSASDTPSEGAIEVVGGYIAGRYAAFAVSVEGGTFNMYSGNICCNSAGVSVNTGVFNLYGGSISHNHYDKLNGTGVLVKNGTFNMSGGYIEHNESQMSSVTIEGDGAFNMSNGFIRYNKNGGISASGNFNLTGGTITDNVWKDDYHSHAGGIMFDNSYNKEFHISGNPVIKDNLDVYGNASNINCRISHNWVDSVDVTTYMTIDGPLTNEEPYGIITLWDPAQFTVDNMSQYKDHFVSEDPDWKVRVTSTGALTLVDKNSHNHNLSYAADGATITATCSANDCDLQDNKATLTLLAPTDLVYSGSAKAATIKEGYDTEIFPNPEIKYYQGSAEVTQCVNVGTYAAKVTYENATAVAEFSITKATPTVESVSDRNATYGQSLSEIDLPDGWAWNSPNDKVGNAGTRQHKATFTPTDADNYSTVEQNVNVIVAKATEYTVPTGLTALVNKTLSTVALPAGWAWDNPNQNVGSELGEKTFKGTYTPADTNNYNIVEHVDITVLVTEHEHSWSYTANGASITASCNNANCPVNEGLSLTLKVPTSLQYDGNAKVATLQEGYSSVAFPNPEIKYFNGSTEVNGCVNVGKYVAKVTFGNATASVEFEIVGKTMINNDVSIEIDDAVVPENIELRVEVRTDVAQKDVAEDYAKIQNMLENDEEISNVYDVKLIQTIGGVEKAIQPSDIKPGLKITVRMAIPEGINMSKARILHIHSVEDMEFVSDYKVDGDDLVFEIDRLSQFAFVTKVNAPAPQPGGGGSHGFCIAWVAFILDILFILAVALYLTLIKFQLSEKMGEKINGLVCKLNEKISGKGNLIDYIISGVIGVNFLFDLIILIAHHCPVSVVAFILALLLLFAILFLLLFFVFAKYIIIKQNDEDKVVKAIKLGKEDRDDKKFFKMMTFKFRRELKPEEEVFSKKQDAEDFLKNHKGEKEQPSEDK